jgi:hypothetical protein
MGIGVQELVEKRADFSFVVTTLFSNAITTKGLDAEKVDAFVVSAFASLLDQGIVRQHQVCAGVHRVGFPRGHLSVGDSGGSRSLCFPLLCAATLMKASFWSHVHPGLLMAQLCVL